MIFKVRFNYSYKNESCDEWGPTWKGKFPSLEDFLDYYGIKDLGNGIAEQTFSDECLKELIINYDREFSVSIVPDFFITEEKKYDAGEFIFKNRDVNDWIYASKELGIAIKRDVNYLWEAGVFNERMAGPYLIGDLKNYF